MRLRSLRRYGVVFVMTAGHTAKLATKLATTLAIILAIGLAGCEYNGSSLTDVVTIDGVPEDKLTPSFPLNLPPEERLRTADERQDLLEDLQSVSETQGGPTSGASRRISTRALANESKAHFENAISEIESQSSQPYKPTDCVNVDQDPETEC